ncbi:MAG: YcgN family cysteine cluster protein [Alphaproteobacteria bacterium]|nr:MAG: YcgN family cysteine cluster protein [Alphaproteobacteria bacterium]
MKNKPFWKTKALTEMTDDEWESLCDGCARCCLLKLEDEDTGEIIFTNVSCRLLDQQTCRCTSYQNRSKLVPTCIKVTAENAAALAWMPPTCAYRLLAEGKDLFPWHPLVSGDPESVHKAGISVLGRVVSEEGIDEEDLEDYQADWPGEADYEEEIGK